MSPPRSIKQDPFQAQAEDMNAYNMRTPRPEVYAASAVKANKVGGQIDSQSHQCLHCTTRPGTDNWVSWDRSHSTSSALRQCCYSVKHLCAHLQPSNADTRELEETVAELAQQLEAAHLQLEEAERERAGFAQEIQRLGEAALNDARVSLHATHMLMGMPSRFYLCKLTHRLCIPFCNVSKKGDLPLCCVMFRSWSGVRVRHQWSDR